MVPALDDTRRDLANRFMHGLAKIAYWPLIVQNCLIRLAPLSLGTSQAQAGVRSMYWLSSDVCLYKRLRDGATIRSNDVVHALTNFLL